MNIDLRLRKQYVRIRENRDVYVWKEKGGYGIGVNGTDHHKFIKGSDKSLIIEEIKKIIEAVRKERW